MFPRENGRIMDGPNNYQAFLFQFLSAGLSVLLLVYSITVPHFVERVAPRPVSEVSLLRLNRSVSFG